MKKICIVIITCIASVFLFGCQWEVENDTKQNTILSDNDTFNINETIKIEEYLVTSVPELANYKRFIEQQSNGESHLIVETKFSLLKIGETKFYPVYVGEQWDDHRVNWEWFYVSEQMDEILWYNLVDDEFYSLEEWRNSKQYRTVD